MQVKNPTINVEVEKAIVLKVEKHIRVGDFPLICFDVGKFIEVVATETYQKLNQSSPKTSKSAIDFLIEKGLIERRLGYKLHVVREIRNLEGHILSYPITLTEANLAVETLNQTIGWLHKDNLAREWRAIDEMFSHAEHLMRDRTINSSEEEQHLVFKLYEALGDALQLKIRSLNLETDRRARGYFSSVELLAKHGIGINVRSEAWSLLTHLRNRMAHGVAVQPVEFSYVRDSLPELREILTKLNPLSNEAAHDIDFPQVTLVL